MTAVTFGLAAGFGLGALFFGGLWLTLRRLEGARRPGLLVLSSFLARLALTGAGLWWVARAGGPALLGALVGMLAARELLRRGLAPPPARRGRRRAGGSAVPGGGGR